jgi:hypothetical protein
LTAASCARSATASVQGRDDDDATAASGDARGRSRASSDMTMARDGRRGARRVGV